MEKLFENLMKKMADGLTANEQKLNGLNRVYLNVVVVKRTTTELFHDWIGNKSVSLEMIKELCGMDV